MRQLAKPLRSLTPQVHLRGGRASLPPDVIDRVTDILAEILLDDMNMDSQMSLHTNLNARKMAEDSIHPQTGQA